jgi:hypothetical protein
LFPNNPAPKTPIEAFIRNRLRFSFLFIMLGFVVNNSKLRAGKVKVK